jgi:hypothetical protein
MGVCVPTARSRRSRPAWYTMSSRMPYRVLIALVLLLGFRTASFAAESGTLALTIVRAEQKTRDRVVSWVVDTPIYNEDPYFEVAVRTAGTVIVAERDPESRREMLPEYWKPGTLVRGRVDGRHLFLRRLNGTEVRFIITHRTKVSHE